MNKQVKIDHEILQILHFRPWDNSQFVNSNILGISNNEKLIQLSCMEGNFELSHKIHHSENAVLLIKPQNLMFCTVSHVICMYHCQYKNF